jgi:uncharacterized membrane protein
MSAFIEEAYRGRDIGHSKHDRIMPIVGQRMRNTHSNTTMRGRFWEIDLLRTLAIVLMIVFHALYVPKYLGIADTMTVVRYGFWWWFPRVTAVAPFTFLAGLSLAITDSRGRRISEFLIGGLKIRISAFVLRGVRIFALGMVITLFTWLVDREGYVRFGILHFFGIAFMIGHFFTRFRFINLALGVALLAIGIYLDSMYFDFSSLLWLGLKPHGVRMMDYIPLLPWFGLFLLGMFCSKMLYPEGNRRFSIRELNDPVTRALTLPGRHPLVIYLAQWPVIVGILFILFPDKLIPYLPF